MCKICLSHMETLGIFSSFILAFSNYLFHIRCAIVSGNAGPDDDAGGLHLLLIFPGSLTWPPLYPSFKINATEIEGMGDRKERRRVYQELFQESPGKMSESRPLAKQARQQSQ